MLHLNWSNEGSRTAAWAQDTGWGKCQNINMLVVVPLYHILILSSDFPSCAFLFFQPNNHSSLHSFRSSGLSSLPLWRTSCLISEINGVHRQLWTAKPFICLTCVSLFVFSSLETPALTTFSCVNGGSYWAHSLQKYVLHDMLIVPHKGSSVRPWFWYKILHIFPNKDRQLGEKHWLICYISPVENRA